MRHITDCVKSAVLLVLIVLAGAGCVSALGLGTFENEFRYTPDQTSSIKYFLVKGETEPIAVVFDYEGSLEPYVAFRLDNYWYSTRVDKLNVYIESEFDLTNVSSASLTFKTKYDIEYGWDFGYVEVSTNNGSTWSQLSGTSTTTYRDPGAYVGVPGAPAYTGTVSGWTLETMDLTPYVGNVILLRFRYVSDDYYAEHGWLVDDIYIPEIGFFDDVQSASTVWTSTGWLRNVLELNASVKRDEVFLDFVIPSNYTYNNTDEKVIVTEIAGVDQDYNPSQGSVARIITMFPDIVRIIPPPPSGGGGGGQAPYFARKIDDVVTFIISGFEPHREYTMRSLMADMIVQSIRIMLNSAVDGATIRVTPLDTRPVSIKKDLPDVYSYFEVSTVNMYDWLVERAVLEVAVSKDWIADKGVGPDEIVVSRFSSGVWSDIDTKRVGEDKEDYLYDAYSPGFSVFAVRVRSPIEPEEVIVPQPTVKPDISKIRDITIVADDETLEDIRSELLKKSNLTGAGADVRIPSLERPKSLWLQALTVVLVLLAALASIAVLAYRLTRHAWGLVKKKDEHHVETAPAAAEEKVVIPPEKRRKRKVKKKVRKKAKKR